MNPKIKNIIMLSAVMTVCLSLGQSTFAQSSCRQAKGHWIDVLNPVNTTGTITNGGFLNGTTETEYNPAFVFTPDPNVVSYIAETTITTSLGQLNTSNVYIYNFVTGLWTAMGNINPATSTGRFAGTTGVLYFNGKTTDNGSTYPSEIAGEICFGNQ